MEYSKVQRRSQRAMSERMLERYPMSNSDLFSSENSSEDDISDLVYRNLRFKSPMELPFRMDNFTDGSLPVSYRLPELRPQSFSACAKCNQIRTNPRFRPNSFHYYGKLKNMPIVCLSDTSEDEINLQKRKSFSNKRRRNRLKQKLR